jgi:DNA-binding NtrC family response regulator
MGWSDSGYQLNGLIGQTPAMKEVFDLIVQVCKTDCTVLILGESGTGKELVARAIHKNSRRRHMPLITVNCGAIPENLQESELFGHVKGSFTGADKDKIGILQEADGGTVFLDEIGEMSLSTQVKLLRFLQYGEIRRIGENRPVHVDVRLIAATNMDLEEAIETKVFREDLYYRLNVVAIYLPPLRDRRDDIPLLANHFLNRFSQKMEKRVKGISPDAMAALMDYDWPGNVRELENAIERAVVLTRSDLIELEDLPPKVRYGSTGFRYRFPLSKKGKTFRARDDLTLEELERAYIVHKLKRCKTYEEAARQLGIGRTTLWRKIKRYGITPDEIMRSSKV